jgi:pectate lyase
MLCTNHLRTPARTGWSCACIGLVVIATMVGCSSSDDDDEAESTTGGSSSEDSASGGAAATAAGGSAGATESGSVKITQMDDGRRIYLAARYIDSNNWYGAALYNAGTRRAQIRKKSAGSSTDISEVPFAFELNTWYRIELSISGSELSMRIDDVPMTSGTDTEFAAGGIALLADRSVVTWDDIVVTIP